MTENVVNKVAYLRSTRTFPNDIDELVFECDKAYLDTANAVNSRTIGIYPVNKPAITGNKYFIVRNEGRQSLRKIYAFESFANIPHGINFNDIEYQVAGYGNYTDDINWYGIINGTSVLIPGQVVFYLTATDIVFVVDGSEPAISYGIIVLEWASDF